MDRVWWPSRPVIYWRRRRRRKSGSRESWRERVFSTRRHLRAVAASSVCRATATRTFLPQDRRHPKTTVAHIGNSRNHEPELTPIHITENVESFPSCVSPWVDADLRQPHTSYTLQDHGARAASPGVSVYVAGTELYCSVIAAHKREQMHSLHGRAPTVNQTRDLFIVSPTPCHCATTPSNP